MRCAQFKAVEVQQVVVPSVLVPTLLEPSLRTCRWNRGWSRFYCKEEQDSKARVAAARAEPAPPKEGSFRLTKPWPGSGPYCRSAGMTASLMRGGKQQLWDGIVVIWSSTVPCLSWFKNDQGFSWLLLSCCYLAFTRLIRRYLPEFRSLSVTSSTDLRYVR